MRRQNKLLCHHEGFPATSQMSSHHTAGWAVNVGMTFCWSLLHPRCFEFERLWSFNSFSSSFESISRFQGHVYSGAGFSPPWRFRFVSLHLTLTSEQWQKYLETSPHAQVLEEYCRGIKQLRRSQILFLLSTHEATLSSGCSEAVYSVPVDSGLHSATERHFRPQHDIKGKQQPL